MSGAAPPAPPNSPAVFASRSARCEAVYLRYSAPTAKLTGLRAHSDNGVSPLIVARPCESFERTRVVDSWLMKPAMAGVMLPSGPKMFSGTQLFVVVKQLVVLVASSA